MNEEEAVLKMILTGKHHGHQFAMHTHVWPDSRVCHLFWNLWDLLGKQDSGERIQYFIFLRHVIVARELEACGGEEFIRPFFNACQVHY